MNNAPTLVTFLTRFKLFQVPWPELDLYLEAGSSNWTLSYDAPVSQPPTSALARIRSSQKVSLMEGSKAECQAALRIIFEFIANCGQIETPSIMIDMEAVAQAAKKRA